MLFQGACRALVAGLVLVACSPDPPEESRRVDEPPISSPRGSPRPTPTDGVTAAPRFRPARIRVALQPVAEGFESPLLVTNAGDGSDRLFVVEQGGEIYALARRGGRRLFLDVTELTEGAGEQGLLGLAFHPRFERNGRFFVNYTDNAGDTVVAEYRSPAGTVADPGSARRLLAIPQPAPNHNGGGLAFGPDGYLYIGTGDGGGAGDPEGNGQSRTTLLGKMLRIDVDHGKSAYATPVDNPFVGEEGARPEIWAYGLRNPWRFSFDRATGNLWIGDVGQSGLEEIDRVDLESGSGANFGWNVMEGTSCYAVQPCDPGGMRLPITQYGHASGCSVTGGYVYRGERWPELVGGYFFGDYCSGTIWAIDSQASGRRAPSVVLQSEHLISSFGEDEAGELYVTDLSAGQVLGLAPAR